MAQVKNGGAKNVIFILSENRFSMLGRRFQAMAKMSFLLFA